MTALPETTDPMIAVTQEAVPSVQAAFLKRFSHAIDVEVSRVPDAETRSYRIQFTFRPTKPGLLPTAIERAFFDGFMARYQRCHYVFCDLFTVDEASN